jgi:hypothetical protein
LKDKHFLFSFNGGAYRSNRRESTTLVGHRLTSQHQIVMSMLTIVPMEGHWLTSQHQIVMSILSIVPMEGHWLTSQHQIVMSMPTIVPMEGHWLTSQHQIVMSIPTIVVVFSRSSTIKTDHHVITEILLKVALNTIKQTNKH